MVDELFFLRSVFFLLAISGNGLCSQKTNNYSIIFDAGSYGTRMYIYRYDITINQLTNIEQVDYRRLADSGIDTISTNEDVRNLFSQAIQLAEGFIPREYHSMTPIYLCATGRMRLFNAVNPLEINRLYDIIRDFFQSTKFLFTSQNQVRTLSDTEEAIGEWVTINYILGRFKRPNLKTYGIIRTGDSSAQIAFAAQRTKEPNTDKYLTHVRVNNVLENIYSHSYLCWGTHRAFDFYHTQALKNENFAATIPSPCYPSGYSITVYQSELMTPCSNGHVLNEQYSFVIEDSLWSDTEAHTFEGNSNNDLCKQEVASIIPKAQCSFSSCAFDSVYQPSAEDVTFIGVGDFYETIENTESLLQTTIGVDMEKFEELTEFICQKTYSELLDISAGSDLDDTVELMCFKNRFMLELLRTFGVTNIQQFVDKLDGYKVGWAMGFLILEIENNLLDVHFIIQKFMNSNQ